MVDCNPGVSPSHLNAKAFSRTHSASQGNPLSPLQLLVALIVLMSGGAARAEPVEPTRTQTIQLKKGWNAIWLEVSPENAEPDHVFKDLPVDVVARYFPLQTPVQFIDDPTQETWKKEGWGVWYAPHRDDAILSDLGAIQGNQSYLIQATEDCTWSALGKVRFKRLKWRSGSYNLLGFSLSPGSSPSFQKFFAGAQGKIARKVFRLTNGRWKEIDPTTATLRPNEATWILCEGRTRFQGPIDLTIPGVRRLDFGDQINDLEIEYRNTSSQASEISVGLLGSAKELPLNKVVTKLSEGRTVYPDLAAQAPVDSLPVDAVRELTLQVRRARMTEEKQSAVLQITSDLGHRLFVPVVARKPVPASTDAR